MGGHLLSDRTGRSTTKHLGLPCLLNRPCSTPPTGWPTAGCCLLSLMMIQRSDVCRCGHEGEGGWCPVWHQPPPPRCTGASWCGGWWVEGTAEHTLVWTPPPPVYCGRAWPIGQPLLGAVNCQRRTLCQEQAISRVMLEFDGGWHRGPGRPTSSTSPAPSAPIDSCDALLFSQCTLTVAHCGWLTEVVTGRVLDCLTHTNLLRRELKHTRAPLCTSAYQQNPKT